MKKTHTGVSILILWLMAAFLAAPASVTAGAPIGSRFVIRNDGSATEIEPAIAYNSQRGEY